MAGAMTAVSGPLRAKSSVARTQAAAEMTTSVPRPRCGPWGSVEPIGTSATIGFRSARRLRRLAVVWRARNFSVMVFRLFARRARPLGAYWHRSAFGCRRPPRAAVGRQMPRGRSAGVVQVSAPVALDEQLLVDLAAVVLGEIVHEDDPARVLVLGQPGLDVGLELVGQGAGIAALGLGAQDDDGLGLGEACVVARDDGGDRHGGMGEQAVFDLARRD